MPNQKVIRTIRSIMTIIIVGARYTLYAAITITIMYTELRTIYDVGVSPVKPENQIKPNCIITMYYTVINFFFHLYM